MEESSRPPVTYRSVSQLQQYEECPQAYFRQRRLRAWQRPAAWFGHGTAVHKAAEEWERSGRSMSLEAAQDVFRGAYVQEINEALATTPNTDTWFASGPYRGEADIARRFGKGLQMVKSYVDYYNAHPDEVIWVTPAGVPAIELGFKVTLGGVEVRGFIDQAVMVRPTIPRPKSRSKAAMAEYAERVASIPPALRARDIKTGAKPGGPIQLKTYGLALEEMFGTPVETGDFWMGKTGQPSKVVDLKLVSRSEVEDRFAAADEGILAERWDANPGPVCDRCSVASGCPFRFSE